MLTLSCTVIFTHLEPVIWRPRKLDRRRELPRVISLSLGLVLEHWDQRKGEKKRERPREKGAADHIAVFADAALSIDQGRGCLFRKYTISGSVSSQAMQNRSILRNTLHGTVHLSQLLLTIRPTHCRNMLSTKRDRELEREPRLACMNEKHE